MRLAESLGSLLHLSVSAERVAFARALLYAIAAFGVLAAALDYIHGNMIIAVIAAWSAIFLPLFLRWARRADRQRHVLYMAVGYLVFFMLVGDFTQMHKPEKLVWMPIFPFAFYYLCGLRLGTLVVALSALSIGLGYWMYPALYGVSASGRSVSEAATAFVFSSFLAILFERVRERQENALKHLAERDFLTGALNRRGFMAAAAQALACTHRFKETLAVLMVDIDHFKSINDSDGHEMGDRVLRDLHDVLKRQLREADIVARWGGEEFIALLPGTSLEGALLLAEKLRAAIANHDFGLGRAITASFGVAATAGDEALDELIRHADGAMYGAKLAGRDQVLAANRPATVRAIPAAAG